jgi:predicted metal-dependent hydrolase
MAIPIPRDPDIDLSDVPRHWLADNAAATAISNAVNLLFPHGERFFVRSVHHYLDQITDPTLRAQVLAFFKQEGHHARHHEELNAVIRAQGFEVDEFLERYKKISNFVEARMPAKINLAGTAAAEHFTAILAHGAFSEGILDSLHPKMRELLSWHAAEEIEHKAVAFDVLQQIDPSYATRMAGLAYATVMLGGFWLWGTVMFLRQEKLGLRGTLRELGKMRKRDPILRRVFGRGIKQYARRNFHPHDNDNEHLARDWFAQRGMAFTEAA